jgi:hypothetical protein
MLKQMKGLDEKKFFAVVGFFAKKCTYSDMSQAALSS